MEQKRQIWNDGVGALQWLVFLLANSVTLPIVIGQIYHLPANEVIGLMQRTFLVAGAGSFLQGVFGHRLPIPDGPAGTWLGVFAILGAEIAKQSAGAGGAYSTLQTLETGMLAAGIILILFVVTGLTGWMIKLFTPLVTGVYLLLLGLQLGGVFLQGMLGLSGDAPHLDAVTSIVSFGVFIVILVLSVKGTGWLKNYAVFIGIVLGCIAYYALGKSTELSADAGVGLPALFAWGAPKWDGGMAISAVIIAFILMSNTIASIAAMKQVLNERKDGGEAAAQRREADRSGVVGGVVQLLSGAFSTVGTVPLSSSVGFVRMTGQKKMGPYLSACILLAGVAFVPLLIRLLALLPSPVAYASVMASFVNLVGVGLQSITRNPLDQRRTSILGITLLIGSGAMILPASVFETMPSVFRYVLGNGLILGTMIAVILEQVWRDRQQADEEQGA
ncbi:purine/pyrimidine permease [Paenibacillus doosanensis]|uniref:purine/pyrimidine permease n=1 Tax=Paenibacillus doosanensis TaxID=1229154 RepID=UPI00218046CB|nr:purine/pyrimidine permease [Paenibacillus doosanensis]MCS7462027.1 purine/pyrimidine permease [Paenibacillus doosanensis]